MAKKMTMYEKVGLADILIRWAIAIIKAASYCLSGIGFMLAVESIFKLGLDLFEFLFYSGVVTGGIYITLYQFFKNWKVVRTWNYVAGGTLLLISAIINSLSSKYNPTPTVVISTTTVNIRPCPSTTDCVPIGTAQVGERFEVVGETGAFYLIKYGNGTAYISSSPQFTRKL